jgi:molybdopterin-containing oxidoreductase family iron-sulfur binding subunit
MANNNKYWKGIEELERTPDFVERSEKEFNEMVPVDDFLNKSEVETEGTNRRDFLKFLGFSVTAATLAACEAPVTKSIPFLNKPDNMTPGVANYFASTYFDGLDFSSILVKTREGRPIFIQGNSDSPYAGSGVSARVSASVLGLYDSKRAKGPAAKKGASWAKNLTWKSVDRNISSGLNSVAAKGGKVVLLSNTIISPTSKDVIKKFSLSLKAKGAQFSHVTYDSISASGILEANQKSFGKKVIPSYHFNKAKAVVSIGADFLGSWLNHGQYESDFASRRKPENDWMSKFYQFESTLSVTGSNADVRGIYKPSQVGEVVKYLLSKFDKSVKGGEGLSESLKGKLDKAADSLSEFKGESLVVAGSNNVGVQLLVNAINDKLGNYGTTVNIEEEVYTRQGSDKAFNGLAKQMNEGKVDALIILGTNPAYSAPAASKFNEGLSKVGLKVYMGDRLDETGELSDFLAPDHHYLESWNDHQPVKGLYTLQQPAIKNLFNTRQWQESLMAWTGEQIEFGQYLASYWKGVILGSASASDWQNAVQKGFYKGAPAPVVVEETEEDAEMVADSAMTAIPQPVASNNVQDWVSSAVKMVAAKSGEWELEMYTKTLIGDGKDALIPWVHETPDPITKMTYDNYVTIAPSDALKILGLEDNKANRRDALYIGEASPAKVVEVSYNGSSIQLPMVPQPGQAPGSIGIALGYGRKGTEQFTREEWLGDLFNAEDQSQNTIGKNVFPWLRADLTYQNTITEGLSVKLVEGASYPMATTQTHHTMMGRKLVNETTLATFVADKGKAKDKHGYNEQLLIADAYGEKKKPEELDLWAEHPIDLVHRWGLSIDLNTCFGCGACVTACHIENNVPAVGKDEVRRSREMHWLRIDRYYSATPEKEVGFKKMDELHSISDYADAEVSEDEPQVAFQPVMCQHCNHAPCETVCPVAATTHSNEGFNQMAYNRCIGTRYCANNCPYKVRRFNWFQYDSLNLPAFPDFAKVNMAQDDLGRMVLNPDVVVRSRGVMEKCSMCVQRVQAGKLDAKKKGERVQDGAIQTACSSACPTNAITFGDLNDSAHQIYKEKESERAYFLLEEVGVQPNVYYQTKVRNV